MLNEVILVKFSSEDLDHTVPLVAAAAVVVTVVV